VNIMAKGNEKQNDTPTTENTPEIENNGVSDAIASRIKSGGMKADTVQEIGAMISIVANHTEVLRLKSIIFEDSKKIDRLSKVFTESRLTVKDFEQLTGARIVANATTKNFVASLKKGYSGALSESQFNALFKLDKEMGEQGCPCVHYD